MVRKPTRLLGVKITVGDERPVAGDSKLPTVGVSGQNQLGIVRCHCVKDP